VKAGTPDFRGARLVEAREARSLTGIALADLVGVTRGAISQYEKNLQTPRPEVMQRFTEVLNLPVEFFQQDAPPNRAGVINYRSLAAATKMPRRSAERRHGWLRHTVSWLMEMVDLPRLDFPDFGPPNDPTLLTAERVEWAATQTRRHWAMGDGPIQNVVWLLENHGAVISLSDFGSEELDAFSESGKEGFEPFVSLSADKTVAARANFTAAHELGHLLLHRDVPENVSKRSAEHKLMEQQANAFADAFLLPESTFISQVRHPSLDLFRSMKSRWRVSIGAMIMRSRSLGLIDEEQYRRLWIAYSKRGWKHGEPLDDELSHSGPRVLRRTFELLLNERVISREHTRASLPYASSDIEKLCGLDEGYLSDGYSTNMVRLPPATSPPPTRAVPGEVIQFNRKRNLR
jgi:Zn-dependent peptidase ImmA (M78 family)/DNA-binding XRE family transcriptional regulator